MSEPVCSQYQDKEGNWKPFINADHEHATRDSMAWHVRDLYIHPDPRVAELEALLRECRDEMKMKYTEQAVETLDDAGSVIANKNIEIEQLRQRVAELERGLDSAYQLADHYRDERDALKKLYESSEEYVIALKETRNRLAEERDEWRSKHDVACLTITNLQSKYECQLSATSKAMQGVSELTAERDALKQQRDELLAALRSFVACAYPVSTKFDPRGRRWCEAWLDQALLTAEAAIASVKEKA